jgi:prophage regulatory protein
MLEKPGREPQLPSAPSEHAASTRPSPITPLPIRRTVRRPELRRIVPIGDTTIYEMEQRGEFPRRFQLSPRCVVWDLQEVEAWIEERKRISRSEPSAGPSGPNVRYRKTRPVRR